MQNPIVYDKAKYHDDSVAKENLNWQQSFVHTGLFFGWLIDHDLLREDFLNDNDEEIEAFKQRKKTGPQIYEYNDGVLVDDMLNEEGNAFAQFYFDFDSGQFISDYEELMSIGLPSFFHVQDTWENYEKLKSRLDQRYESWKRNSSHRSSAWQVASRILQIFEKTFSNGGETLFKNLIL